MPGTIKAEWLVILICPPGRTLQEPAGILLLDRQSNQLSFKLKAELSADDDDVNLVWNHLAEELKLRVARESAVEVVDWLETTWSHVVRVTVPNSVQTENLDEALDALYEDHVERQGIAKRPA